MLSKTFVYAQDADSGLIGWRPLDQAEFSPGDPMLVAHDTLEHFANDTGALTDELRALGAFAFIRIDTGFVNERGLHMTGEEILASLVESTIRRALMDSVYEEIREIAPPPPTRRLNAEVYGDWPDAWFQNGAAKGVELLRKELQHNEDSDLAEVLCTSETVARVADWLRIGYRAAFKRYRGDCNRALLLLKQIQRDVDEVNKSNDVEFGDKLRVSASIVRRNVKVSYLPARREEKLN